LAEVRLRLKIRPCRLMRNCELRRAPSSCCEAVSMGGSNVIYSA
jgi:hypothetical protein